MRETSIRAATEVDKEIGARIRARRQELELSQAYVADVIGVTFQQLQKYEAGENRVAAATLLQIAKVLRTEPTRMLPTGRSSTPLPSKKRGHKDALAEQLQLAFSRISSPRERRLILELARRLAGGGPKAGPQRSKPPRSANKPPRSAKRGG